MTPGKRTKKVCTYVSDDLYAELSRVSEKYSRTVSQTLFRAAIDYVAKDLAGSPEKEEKQENDSVV